MPKIKTDPMMPLLKKMPDFNKFLALGEIPITFVLILRRALMPEEKMLQNIPVFNRNATDKIVKDILTKDQIIALRQLSDSTGSLKVTDQ